MAGVMVGGEEKETRSDDELITYIPYDTRDTLPPIPLDSLIISEHTAQTTEDWGAQLGWHFRTVVLDSLTCYQSSTRI
jgi:hypothetical protein